MNGIPFRLYIVEDHPMMREVYSKFFHHAGGYEICGTAETAEQALEEIPTINPDLALIDISLPGMNGLNLVEELQACCPEIRTVVVSGHEDSHYRQAALRAGATDFVSKGSASSVLETIQKVLGSEAAPHV